MVHPRQYILCQYLISIRVGQTEMVTGLGDREHNILHAGLAKKTTLQDYHHSRPGRGLVSGARLITVFRDSSTNDLWPPGFDETWFDIPRVHATGGH